MRWWAEYHGEDVAQGRELQIVGDINGWPAHGNVYVFGPICLPRRKQASAETESKMVEVAEAGMSYTYA